MNSYTTGYQVSSAVAMDSAGRFVVVWSSYPQDGSSWGVFGQRFDSDGNRLGGEFQINSYTTGDQRYPSVAANAAGGFVVVWESSGLGVPDPGVHAQRYDSSGNRAGETFQVSSGGRAAVSTDDPGNFVVAWSEYRAGSSVDVFARRYDLSGKPLGGEFRVNSYTTSLQFEPAVSMAKTGAFVVSWTSRNQDGSGDAVFARRYDAAGDPLGDEFQVNSYTTLSQHRSAVSSSATGSFVVAWRSSLQDGDRGSIHARLYDAAGMPLGDEFQVNTYTTGEQREAAVASDPSGKFVLSWTSSSQDGDVYGVFARRYAASGGALSDEFQVNSYTTDWQCTSSVASDGGGNFVVVWESFHADLYGDIFGRRYRVGIFSDGFESGDTSAWSGSAP